MALLLLSGGTDSACLAHVLRPNLCLTIDYGQKVASAEINSSRNICRSLNLKHCVVKINLRDFATGSMAGKKQALAGAANEWWPFRNQLIVTVGAMVAFKNSLTEVIIGTVRSDRRHKDGSAKFIRQMDQVLRQQEGAVRLLAPARKLYAEELYSAADPSLDLLGMTFSCHRSIYPCGQCDGCRKNEAVISFAIAEKKRRAVFGRTKKARSRHALEI